MTRPFPVTRVSPRACWALVGALLLLLAVPAAPGSAAGRSAPSARAAASMPGPGYLDTGFSDIYAFQESPAAQGEAWFARAQRLGSSYVRLDAIWSVVEPTRPAPGTAPGDPNNPSYHWASLDLDIEQAVAHGQHVVLMIVIAPPWAQGAHPTPLASTFPGSWRPNPSALGAFAHALAERYSGRFREPADHNRTLPAVHYFQAWNEPNLPNYLTPQWTRTGSGQWAAASPAFYRRMLNAVYAGVKAVQPDAFVLAAGTGPYGDPPGGNRMAPVVFDRALLCLTGSRLKPAPCPDPAHFDAFDHHPYSLTPTVHAASPDDVSVPDLGRLKAILRVAERTGRALPAGPKPIWVTEIAWSSKPPDPLAIPIARQGRYLSLTFYELWREGVSHVFWLLISDYPYKSLTGSGIYFMNATPKPSAQDFQFPFVALPARGRERILWGRAPGHGTVVIERRDGHSWTALLRLSTTPGGIFYAERRLDPHLVLRAQLGSAVSLPWSP